MAEEKERESDDQSFADFMARREFMRGQTAVDALETATGVADKPQNIRAQAEAASGQMGKSIGAGAFSAAKDIGRGITEAPSQIVGGAVAAAENMYNTVDDLSEYLNEKIPALGAGVVLKDGGIEFVSGSEMETLKAENKDLTRADLSSFQRDPETKTGALIKGVSQFVTGFAVGGKALKGVKAVTGAGKLAKAGAQGAFSDFTAFDGHEERLSNLIQEHPTLANPITELLAANPEDTKFEGKIKNTIEGVLAGAGIHAAGIAAEALMRGVKSVRAAKAAKAAQKEAQAKIPNEDGPLGDAAQKAEELRANEVALNAPSLELKDFENFFGGSEFDSYVKKQKVKPREKLESGKGKVDAEADARRSKTQLPRDGDGDVKINFNRIETQEDVKKMMQKMANTFSDDINTAKRGKRTFAQIKQSAGQKKAFKLLMERRTGQAFNAEEITAARNLYTASGEKLAKAAEEAAQNGSPASLYKFQKMMGVHQVIQREVLAAQTETARALSAMKINAKSGKRVEAEINDILEASGGNHTIQSLARRISQAAKDDDFELVERMVEKSKFKKTMGAIQQVWINGLLSGPKTHIVNITSNAGYMAQRLNERAVAARISKALGTESGVAIGEASAMMHGMVTSFKDALRASRRAFKTGESEFGERIVGKAEEPLTGALSADTWKMSSETSFGRALDAADHYSRTPGRALAAGDEFFKTIAYRAELHALAHRQASKEFAPRLARGESFSGLKNEFDSRLKEIVENPPESLKLESIDAAHYATFTQTPNKWFDDLAQKVQRGTILDIPVGRVIMPFRRTPINIMTAAFERTPFAPISANVRAEIRAGGARRDMMLTKIGTGTAVMATVMDYALSEHVTGSGPSKPSERQIWLQTHKPYSVKLGDTWVQYNRAEPLGTTMGIMADMTEVFVNADEDQLDAKSTELLYGAALFSVADQVLSKTYMSGLSDMVSAIDDPTRNSEKWIKRMAGSVVPAAIGQVARAQDPTLRATESALDAVKARIPHYAKDLPPVRDLFGDPIEFKSGLGGAFDLLSPFNVSTEKPEPIAKELEAIEFYPQKPSRSLTFRKVAVKLNAAEYSRYLELQGSVVKPPGKRGLGMKDYLNALVMGVLPESRRYKDMSPGPDGDKAMFLRDVFREYRAAAKRELIRENEELQNRVIERGRDQGELINPALLGL